MAFLTGLALLVAAVQPPPAPAAASATTPASAPAIDPARLTAARAVVMASDPQRQLNQNLDTMADVTIRQMAPELERQMSHPLTGADRQQLTTAFRADMAEMYAGIWPNMLQGMIEGYASLFTVAELRHMGELMRDPLMQRMVELMPQLTQRMFERVNLSEHPPRMTRMFQVVSELVPRSAQEATTTTTTTTTRTRTRTATPR